MFTITESADDKETKEFVAAHRLLDALLPPHRLKALLVAAGGSPLEAFALGQAIWMGQSIGLTLKQVERLNEAKNAPLPPRFTDRVRTLGVKVITYQDPEYPANLLPLDDAPPLLMVRGTLLSDDKFSVAIVGTRKPTAYGRTQAETFARAFAERGLIVVSGGASGIDAAAHRGALSAGQRTIAVLGCGVDIVYPAENRELFAEIVAKGGALVSEFSIATKPEPWRFPARNRIIAGMTRATVLAETPDGSGALGTSRATADYGRDVWVVPGPVDTGRSRGGHRLIQDGANLADSPDDVLEGLGLTVTETVQPVLPLADEPETPSVPKALPDLSPDEAALLRHFDLTPKHLDEAADSAGLAAASSTVAATLLEMKGLIKRHPGNQFSRTL